MKYPVCKDYSVLNKDDLKALDYIFSALTPENLSCDGEASKSFMNAKKKKLHAELSKLEKKLNISVDEEAFYNYIYSNDINLWEN